MPRMHLQETILAYTDQGTGQPVILVHGSASSRQQWRKLAEELAGRYRVLAPDLYGYGETSHWPRKKKLTPEDETALIRALADQADEPIHLVGHSYGGSICLHAARELRDRLASLTLIEPVAFPLLRDGRDLWAWTEISELAQRHIALVEEGELLACAQAFMSYWVGEAAWLTMPLPMRVAIITTMPKIAAEWQMIFDDRTDAAAYADLDLPTLLVRGTETTRAARRVVDILAATLPRRQLVEIEGAGHMSPVTHAAAVNTAVKAHLARYTTPTTNSSFRKGLHYGTL